MRQIYNKYNPATGPHNGGLCSIKIAPVEWLYNPVETDFATGRILADVSFIEGRDFINIELLQDSYDFLEKPKSSKAGSFYEISISGLSNTMSSGDMLALNTYRYHQFIALVKDRSGSYRLVGNTVAGVLLQYGNRQNNDKGGSQVISIDLSMDMEYPAPYYGFAVEEPVGELEYFDDSFDDSFN